ncbi:MAG TPA: flagellar hook-length control protein FliK [Oxalicibacterium sp.]|nr:flagellar hook-length control protein FliK [Oxalicibacterium sp.]
MNTSAVNSPVNLLQNVVPTAGKADTGNADGASFNQMLSREMSSADKSGAPSAAQPAQPAGSKDAPKSVQQDGNGKDDTAKSDTAANSQDAAATDAGKKADDDGKVASGKDVKKGEDKDTDKLDPTDQAGIAAFVAALTSAKASPAEAATAETAQPVVAAVDGKGEIKAKNDRIDIASKIANQDAAASGSEQDAVGKKSDFVSALDKAKADTGSDGKDASTSEKSSEAASVKTIKVLDGAAAANSAASVPQTFAAAIAAAVVQPNSAAPNATASSELLPPVGGAGWDDALGQKVVWMAKGMEQTATLTLNPPDLGPMQVTVNVSNNQATASFVAHQPEVRHALEASMPRLRDMLNEAGIQLGQSSVSAGMPNQQGGFDEARHNGSGRRAGSGELVDTTAHVSHVPAPRGGSGMVDTFA